MLFFIYHSHLENNIHDHVFLRTELKQVNITQSEKLIELPFLHTLLE